MKLNPDGNLIIPRDGKPIGLALAKEVPVSLRPEASGLGLARLGMIRAHVKAGATAVMLERMVSRYGGAEHVINDVVEQELE